MKVILDLVQVFFKIGLFSFGGGLAMVPLFIVEFEKQGWMTSDEFFNILSLAQMTPGAIAMNSATYVGNDVYGVLGGVIATTALAAPSVIVMLILSQFLRRMKDNPVKKAFFFCIKPVTIALILFAGWSIAQKTFFVSGFSHVNWKGILLCAACVAVLFLVKKVHPIILILGSALIGILIF